MGFLFVFKVYFLDSRIGCGVRGVLYFCEFRLYYLLVMGFSVGVLGVYVLVFFIVKEVL